ncbi:MAG: flagellar hook-length control protein FliK [Nitrospinae bacterium]|nr:flagellar hook-length control protein FliK [Nitrospinota bacterium]
MYINQLPQTLLSAALKALGQRDLDVLFSKGDVVEGKVLKNLQNNQTLVRLRGVEMVAVSQTKLTPGQTIVGRIESVQPQLTVSLLPGGNTVEAKSSTMMRFLLPAKAPLGETLAKALDTVKGEPAASPKVQEALKNLGAVMEKVVSTDMNTLTPEKAAQTIKSSGLFMESSARLVAEGKLAPEEFKKSMTMDLKAALSKTLQLVDEELASLVGRFEKEQSVATAKTMDAAQQPKQAPQTAPEKTLAQPSLPQDVARPPADKTDEAVAEMAKLRETAKGLRQLMSNVELNQLVNATQKREDGSAMNPMLYQIPFAQNGAIDTARVYFLPDGGKGKGENAQGGEKSLVFMLDMSNLGPVRVDVWVGEKQAHGSIYVADDAVADYVRGALPELLSALEAGGYRATINVSAVADTAFLTEELAPLIPVTGAGLINVKA